MDLKENGMSVSMRQQLCVFFKHASIISKVPFLIVQIKVEMPPSILREFVFIIPPFSRMSILIKDFALRIMAAQHYY